MTETVQPTERPHPDPLPEGEGENPVNRRLITAIKWILCFIVIGYVAFALIKHIRRIDWSSVHFDFSFAVLAGVCFVLVTVTQIIAYRFLLSSYGSPPSWPQAATLSWVPALGKYVPGKIAALGGTVYLLRRFKISAPIALSVALMTDAIAVLTGLIIAAPTLRLPEVRERVPGGWIWCVVLIVTGLVCLSPPVFTRLLNIILRKLNRAELRAIPRVHHYAVPVLAALMQWILWGIVIWCTARSLSVISITQLPAMIYLIALANTIAYLMVFSPGGIGVREGILLAGLTPIIGKTAAIVVIAVRVIQTIVEIILAGIGILILRRKDGD
jgi:glycosyltransferase 2 family protein